MLPDPTPFVCCALFVAPDVGSVSSPPADRKSSPLRHFVAGCSAPRPCPARACTCVRCSRAVRKSVRDNGTVQRCALVRLESRSKGRAEHQSTRIDCQNKLNSNSDPAPELKTNVRPGNGARRLVNWTRRVVPLRRTVNKRFGRASMIERRSKCQTFVSAALMEIKNDQMKTIGRQCISA